MATADDIPRPSRVVFFRTASDDELVDVEAFIVAYCDAHVRAQRTWNRIQGKRRNWQCNPVQLSKRRCRYGRALPYGGHLREHVMDEMRAEVESAARAGLLMLRDRLGHILATLQNRGQFAAFVGVYARMADLAAFAFDHWDVRNEPDEQRTAPGPARNVHRTKGRPDVLRPLIDRSMQSANGVWPMGWTVFVGYAMISEPEDPLVGYVANGKRPGVKYKDGAETKILTRDAYRKRVNPDAR